MKWEVVILGGYATGFGAWALYLGYDGVVIGGVLSFLSAVAGYIHGKRKTASDY